ncbi:unnamed protein product [Fusarium equiseti]|uniref:Zn(2)-C6 fungal-type domain-containing protein n=1 Tax=Fusarium equiseti TaxID=61235 RepID=A0A8J2IGV8_FUSEQ|nr:unnamed protein product [Fusarium equiseti]
MANFTSPNAEPLLPEDGVVDASVKSTHDESAESDQSNQSEDDETDIESDDDRIEEYAVSLDNTSDFGVSDVEKYIRENLNGWKNPPDPTDWHTVRCLGTAKKAWPKDMAIEAEFRDFKAKNAPVDVETRRILKDTPGTRLLRGVIVYIVRHYDDLEEEKRVAEKKGGKAAKYNTSIGNSKLVRTTRKACKKALRAYLAPTGTYGGMNTPWNQYLPPHAQILACGYVGKDGDLDGRIAGNLALVGHYHLQRPEVSGSATNIAVLHHSIIKKTGILKQQAPMELDPRLGATGDRASSLTNFGSDGTSGPSPSHNVSSGSGSLMPFSHSHDAHDDHNSADNTPSASAENRDTPQHQQSQFHDEHDGDANDPKRPRACEACRGLKVRCEPDPNDEGPCKRCRKAGRNCVVTMPTRKRQKKTDSRVAELEKKIDALTASLQARAAPAGGQTYTQAQAHGAADSPRNVTPKPPNDSSLPVASHNNASWRPPTHPPAWGSFASTQPLMPQASAAEQNSERASPAQSTATMNHTPAIGQKRKFSDGREGSVEQPRAEETPAEALAAYLTRAKGGDIVERGIITMDKATELFARYNDHMISHLPAVIFQPGFTASELRKTKPILFLAIMAVASAESPALQKTLQKEMMLTFAEKVILSGEKSLELVQAINVGVIWYWPPEHFEELKFYQLVHMSAVMAIDIGLGQKFKQRRGLVMPDTWRPAPGASLPGPPMPQNRRWTPPDSTSLESRRTWLTCYFLATNTSMALHRPNLIRWTPFMDESLQLLQSSPDAAPTDAYFCHIVWAHHLSEEVGIQFSLDDPTTDINMSDPRIQYILRGLEQELKQYKEKVPQDLLQPTLLISFGVLNLYMHEVALQSRTESLRPPFSTANLQNGLVGGDKLSAAYISAVSTCLVSIRDMLSTFLAMDVFSVRCLPVFNFVRVAYAVVMLIKLYFTVSATGSDLGRVINKEDLQVGKYLDGLLDKFRATAADDRCRPAAKFLVVLVMLRSWFYKQAKSEAKESQPAPPPPSVRQSPSQQQQAAPVNNPSSKPSDRASTANTPLQLLSEVATGAGSRNRESSASRPSVVGWGSSMPQAPQPFFHDTSDNASNSTASMPYYNEPFPADLAAAMAPVMPYLPSAADGMGNNNNGDIFDFPNLIPGWDLEGMGMGLGSQGMWEDGMRIFLEEPWFNTMFQGNPATTNPNLNF